MLLRRLGLFIVCLLLCVHVSLAQTLNIQAYGATTVSDTTASIVAAMAAATVMGNTVKIPPGVWITTGFTIPANVEVRLLRGAILATSGPIILANYNSGLVGQIYGIESPIIAGRENIRWTGGATNSVVQVLGGEGVYLKGIYVNGNDATGITGFLFHGGPAFCVVEHIAASHVANGLDIDNGTQQCRFSQLNFDNDLATQYSSTGFGIRVGGATAAGANTTDSFEHFTIQGFGRGLVLGTAGGNTGCAVCTFEYGIIEGFNAGGIGIDIRDGGTYSIDRIYMETDANEDTGRAVRIGAAGTVALDTVITRSYLVGFSVVFEGFGWDRLFIHDNRFDAAGGTQHVLFRNTGGGLRRMGAQWYANNRGSGATVTEVDDSTGFTRIETENLDTVNNIIRPRIRLGSYGFLLHNNDQFELAPISFRGLVWIFTSANNFGMFVLRGAGIFTEIVYDGYSAFSATQGTGGRLNIYWSAGNNRYEIENKAGGDRSVTILRFEE